MFWKLGMSNVIVNGVIIGIIAVVIFSAVYYTITFQSVTMSGDKLSPMIKNGDLVRYETVPITEIKINDMVVYYEGSFRISKVTMTGIDTYSGPQIEVTDASGYKHRINHVQYQGKVSNVIPNAGYILKDVLAPPKGIWIFIIIFISPMIIMKLRERDQKLKKDWEKSIIF